MSDFRFFDVPADLVGENLALINTRIEAALGTVQGVISQLATIDFDIIDTATPEVDLPNTIIPPVVAPTAPTAGMQFGQVDTWQDPGYVDLSGDAGIDENLILTPVPFAPTVGLPQFGDALGQLDMSGAPTKPTIRTTFASPADPGTFDASGQPEHPVLAEVPLPVPPGDIDISGQPLRPDTAPILIPAVPTLTMPPDPVLIDINAVTPTTYTVPAFAGVRPVFDGTRPTDTFVWDEPTYNGPVLADVEDRVRWMLAGNTALSAAVQNALFSQAREREDMTALADIEDASDEWAGRGFTMPPGMLAKSINAARERAQLQANALSRDILTKVATWTREDIVTAVQQGIALETMVGGWFQAAVGRSFEAAKYHLDVEMKLYDSAIALFNANQSAYQVDAVVLGELIKAELGKLEIFKAELEEELAKGQINDERLKIYLGRLDGVKSLISTFEAQVNGQTAIANNNRAVLEGFASDVGAWHDLMEARKIPFEIYDTKMKGAQVVAAHNRDLVEMFGSDSRAWGEVLQARKIPFDLYSARLKDRGTDVEVEGLIVRNFSGEIANYAQTLAARKTVWETQKLNFEMENLRQNARESEFRAYIESLRGASIEKDNKAKFVELKIAAMRASTEKYQATLGAERERVQTELATVRARIDSFVADTGRYKAEIDGENETRRQAVEIALAQLRNNLAFYEIRLKEYDASLARQQHRIDQILEGVKAAGQYGTALAAGFASSLHVQAGISGSGSVSDQLLTTHKLADG